MLPSGGDGHVMGVSWCCLNTGRRAGQGVSDVGLAMGLMGADSHPQNTVALAPFTGQMELLMSSFHAASISKLIRRDAQGSVTPLAE